MVAEPKTQHKSEHDSPYWQKGNSETLRGLVLRAAMVTGEPITVKYSVTGITGDRTAMMQRHTGILTAVTFGQLRFEDRANVPLFSLEEITKAVL